MVSAQATCSGESASASARMRNIETAACRMAGYDDAMTVDPARSRSSWNVSATLRDESGGRAIQASSDSIAAAYSRSNRERFNAGRMSVVTARRMFQSRCGRCPSRRRSRRCRGGVSTRYRSISGERMTCAMSWFFSSLSLASCSSLSPTTCRYIEMSMYMRPHPRCSPHAPQSRAAGGRPNTQAMNILIRVSIASSAIGEIGSLIVMPSVR